MSLGRYTDVRIDIRSSMLTEHADINLTRDTAAVDVNTVAKGWAGQSPGAGFMTLTIDNAVPSAGFEYDPGPDMATLTPVPITIYAAGQFMSTYGLINSDDLKHGVNQNALQNIKIKCQFSQWQTV